MGILSRFGASSETTTETTTEVKHEKSVLGSAVPTDSIANDDSDEGKQDGVRKVEAAAAVWTKWHLIAAFAK
jgi:hypothetical protein